MPDAVRTSFPDGVAVTVHRPRDPGPGLPEVDCGPAVRPTGPAHPLFRAGR
ncbi:hypothetical protein [Streptomyces sp. NPDC002640]